MISSDFDDRLAEEILEIVYSMGGYFIIGDACGSAVLSLLLVLKLITSVTSEDEEEPTSLRLF